MEKKPISGLKLAVLYSLRPSQLGFCGPLGGQKEVLLEYLRGNIKDNKIKKILRKFEGEYPYLKLIAKSNKIKDPFNGKVVRAYWVGNELLDRVKISDLKKTVIEEFSRPGLLPKEIAERKAEAIPKNSKPHHSFHVLIIGSVTGRVVLEGRLLDLCRICWGRVREISNFPARLRQKTKSLAGGQFPISKIIVRYKPLIGNKLGKEIEKEVDWDRSLVPKVKVGDWVSFHWNQVVEVLTDKDVKNLEKYTKMTLSVI